MKEYYRYKKRHVPEFGSWDDKVPFTKCFESARKTMVPQSYCEYEDRGDLYVTEDLYDNNLLLTPAIIVRPRRKKAKVHEKETKRKNCVNNPRPSPKPIDEDLYKISQEFLYAKVKKKRGLCFFCSCLLPTCIA